MKVQQYYTEYEKQFDGRVKQKAMIPEQPKDKLSLFIWLAKKEDTTVEWAEGFILGCAKTKFHIGDCTKQNHACNLCVLQNILEDYYNYFFDGKKEDKQDWKEKVIDYCIINKPDFDANDIREIIGILEIAIQPLQSQNEELKKENKLLHKAMVGAENRGIAKAKEELKEWENGVVESTIVLVKENRELKSQNEALQKENERLMAIMEVVYKNGLNELLKITGHDNEFIKNELKSHWQQFKQQNNLP